MKKLIYHAALPFVCFVAFLWTMTPVGNTRGLEWAANFHDWAHQ